MNRLLILIVAVFLSATLFAGQNDKNGEVMQTTLKYCTNSIDKGVGVDGGELKMVIQLPDDMMSKYVGNVISRIEIGLLETKKIFSGAIFIMNSLTENPIYFQNINEADMHDGWNTIVLDTPFEITGSEIFVGYQFQHKKGSYPFGISNNSADVCGDWICASSRWSHLKGSNIDANNAIKVIVQGENLVKSYNLAIESLKSKGYTEPDIAIDMNMLLLNKGTVAVSSFDVKYSVNGGQDVVKRIEDISLENDKNYSLNIPITFEKEGVYKVDFSVENINGINENSSAEGKICKTVYVVREYFKRKCLFEYFTSEASFSEQDARESVDALIKGNKNVIWLSYHFSDIYNSVAHTDIADFFKVKMIPQCMVDRTSAVEEMVCNPKMLSSSDFAEALDVPAFVKLNIWGVYDRDMRNLNVTVDGRFIGNVDGRVANLSVCLVEKGIFTESQSGIIDGKYVHAPIVMEFLSDALGNSIEYGSLGDFSQSFSVDLPSYYNVGNMSVVAFVNEYNVKDVHACKVLNAEQVFIDDLKLNGVEDLADKNFIKLFPNPVKDVLNIEGDFLSYEICDMTGKMVCRGFNDGQAVDLSSLVGGMFVLKVVGEKGLFYRKFIKE